MRIIDAHSHINTIFKEFYSDFLKFTAASGIVSIFINSQEPDEAGFLQLLRKCKPDLCNFPGMLFFSALHPWETGNTEKWVKSGKKSLENILLNDKRIFIGETGLDRLRGADIETQKEIFKTHIELGIKYNRPFTIHCVREWGNCIKILESFFSGENKVELPFIVHGFSGSSETMKTLIRLGGYISFSAAMINRENRKTLDNIREIDINRLLIESDFPYSVLDGNRQPKTFESGKDAGKIYTELLIKAYTKTADILNISTEKLCGVIEKNGKVFTDYTASRGREL